MRIARPRVVVVAAAAALASTMFASGARADSLVYMKGGNVWISQGDGSNARQITGAPNTWSWPTEDDSGTILVAGGAGGISAGIEDTPGSEVYRLNQQGASLAAPQQTPGSTSTVSCPTYPPQGLRVAPDGQHYAYHSWFCDHNVTQLGTVGGQGFTSSEYMDDFVFPYWIDNSDFVVSRPGVPSDVCDPGNGHYGCQWWTHDLGDHANYGFPWFADPATAVDPSNPGGWATGFDGVAVSRDGTKVATLEEDAANWIPADAHKVAIRLWSAGGAPTAANNGNVPDPTFKCELDLPADPSGTLWFDNAGPSFSPDGTRLAFAEPDGIHIADVSNLSNCATVTAPLVIAGATQPFWSGGDEAANAGYVAPPSGGGGSQPARDTTPPVIGALTIHPRRFAVARAATPVSARLKRAPKGATLRYTLSEPAEVTFTVQLSTTGRRSGRRCVKATGKLRHARHCVVLTTKGTLTRTAASGANQLAFSGRLGRRALSPGSYRLKTHATDGAGNNSAIKTLSFTIVRR